MTHTAIVIYFAVEVVICHWVVLNIKLAGADCTMAVAVFAQVVVNITLA